jgi:hypothetical protein
VAAGATCTSQTSCTNQTYCDSTVGSCLPGTVGAPCASNANCENVCMNGVCGCSGVENQRQLASEPLDLYFILDRTASMGMGCSYTQGQSPPVMSKACYAQYALCDYLIGVNPADDTHLAFQFMSQPNDCNGVPYETPLIPLTTLPVTASAPIIHDISSETFAGGLGTHIEGALRGLAAYTTAHKAAGREMIGVLMTDGDPNGCDQNLTDLRTIIADHLQNDHIRTYIIGMQGATEANLEELAAAGGADPHTDSCGTITPPCHYWNVGDGSSNAITSALQAIVKQSVPLPCHFDVSTLTPPVGETLDYGKVNVAFTQSGTTVTIGQVANAAACPADKLAWYYDNPSAPKAIYLCPMACSAVGNAGQGARVNVVVGCEKTIVIG